MALLSSASLVDCSWWLTLWPWLLRFEEWVDTVRSSSSTALFLYVHLNWMKGSKKGLTYTLPSSFSSKKKPTFTYPTQTHTTFIIRPRVFIAFQITPPLTALKSHILLSHPSPLLPLNNAWYFWWSFFLFHISKPQNWVDLEPQFCLEFYQVSRPANFLMVVKVIHAFGSFMSKAVFSQI